MNRTELVQQLDDSTKKGFQWKGQKTLTFFFRWYFENQVDNDHEYDGIFAHLHEYIVEAMEFLRESEVKQAVFYRDEYLKETGQDRIPVITSVAGGIERILLVSHLGFMFADVTGWKGAELTIENYLMAEDHVLTQAMQVFNRHVWRKGMWRTIQESPISEMSGVFGSTEFGTFYTAGRVLMTFSRPSLNDQHESVSFVADYSDSFGVRTGLQSMFTSLNTAIEMINEVAQSWPTDEAKRAEVFKET